ncbi:hypothetical protein [Clostridium chrysemydis]|uniref:hypothetical protein n=1 Tax=Clostridium chrysemydis TaxID=2665504 RepID=UPI0018839227|nr:hypothetical protein [Clostridium chrysemydis]
MKFSKIISISLLALVISVPVVSNAKELKSKTGAISHSGIYVSGCGSYTSACTIVNTEDPKVQNESARVLITYPFDSCAACDTGKSYSVAYYQGGANLSYEGEAVSSDFKGIAGEILRVY